MKYPFSIAPMIRYTDQHYRYFVRGLNKKVLSYTEMITTSSILKGGLTHRLQLQPVTSPVAIQFAGNEPKEFAKCASAIDGLGYVEINLNIGCPSPKITNAEYGIMLLKQPKLVAQCVKAIKEETSLPVSLKTRIGIDNNESIELLTEFIDLTHEAGCDKYVLHARKAIVGGLSPRANRQVPPLKYQRVYELKARYPKLEIVINGGITTSEEVQSHLNHVDGVMVGRAAYANPMLVAQMGELSITDTASDIRTAALQHYLTYVESEVRTGTNLRLLVRPLHGLYFATRHAKRWRQKLDEFCANPDTMGLLAHQAELESTLCNH